MPVNHVKIVRYKIWITGRVKGVGFRYHVKDLADNLGLKGYVKNTVAGVTIEVEGEADDLATFISSLKTNYPPYARVEGVTMSEIIPKESADFSILYEG